MPEDAYDDYDDDDDVPLQHKRPFGSGLRRNEIKFVPASSEDPEGTEQSERMKAQGQSISDFYLYMVLQKKKKQRQQQPEPGAQVASGAHEATVEDEDEEKGGKEEICEICKTPLASTPAGGSTTTTTATAARPSRHEASIAHQVCIAHSHPPSALDRGRMGLAVLESQGWDPDARRGLGAAGQGVHHPVKARPKDDRLGVGVVVPRGPPGGAARARERERPPKLLDAKRVRKMAADDRRRTDRLQQQMFGRVDLERYLGPGA